MIFRPQSPEEVNILLPTVLQHFTKIKKLMLEAGKLEPKISPTSPALSSNINSNNTPAPTQELTPEEKALDEIEERLGGEFTTVHEYGGIIKNVFPGRIDFLTKCHGRPAYLCWHEGQNKVSHWQPIEDNFHTQQPITSHKAFTTHYIN